MNIVEQARRSELQTLADELAVSWNPVRLFGTGAGPVSIPLAAHESLRWVMRSLATIERWWREEGKDMSQFKQGAYGNVTTAEVSFYCFLEFIQDCYGVDLTKGSGQEKEDVYGRIVKEDFPKLKEFFQEFGRRESAVRLEEEGDLVAEMPKRNMMAWAEGVL